MRLPPEINDPAASSSDAENHVHGNSPQNMNTEYGNVRFSGFGRMVEKTNV